MAVALRSTWIPPKVAIGRACNHERRDCQAIPPFSCISSTNLRSLLCESTGRRFATFASRESFPLLWSSLFLFRWDFRFRLTPFSNSIYNLVHIRCFHICENFLDSLLLFNMRRLFNESILSINLHRFRPESRVLHSTH